MNHGWSTIERLDSGFVKVPSSRRMLCDVNSNLSLYAPTTMPGSDPSYAYALLEEVARRRMVRFDVVMLHVPFGPLLLIVAYSQGSV
jgi:hypothetical protein